MVVAKQFWGKAQSTGEGETWHPVVAHSLDVAAVAALLAPARGSAVPAQLVTFLVALHDIGKFSRSFQAMSVAHWPAALGPAPSGLPPGPRHDALGYQLLREELASLLDAVLPPRIDGRRAWSGGQRDPLLRAIAGHHGRPPLGLDAAPGAAVFCGTCRAAATEFVQAMLNLFRPAPLPNLPGRAVAGLGWRLAGLTTLADWVGSRRAWFPYVAADSVADPAAYFWDHALPRAARALAAAGLAEQLPRRFSGVGGLFPEIDQPSPAQSWAADVALPDGPVLAVVEDLTGSGKTEAALILAQRLMARGQASGLFFALPTMATANAMFGRLAEAYHRLYPAEARPSLALAHGRADLDPRFQAAIHGDGKDRGRSEADPADDPAEAHCAAWLAEDRRRALLAEVGVGTVDQALLAVLPVRHAALRLQGLAGKVLVVDEAHAFDAYMRQEMVALLEFHAALGGSAILLSATLPQVIRQELVEAFAKGLRVPAPPLTSTAYPLATLAGDSGVVETPCAPRLGLTRRVAVTRLENSGAGVARIVAAARAGAAVAWVRNTVDDALAAAEGLRAEGIEPLLFHARFALADRLVVEREVLRCFGRDSAVEQRNRVLVATQVVEQSLDCDFDMLVSDLAPVDLLIQRAGRLWRHARRPRPVPGPELLVLSPAPVAEPGADWIKAVLPGTASVYRDPALLWRSARAVFGRGAIVTPDDMRPLIEEAFDTQAPGAVPAALAREAERSEGINRAAAGIANQNVLRFDRCYQREAGFWEPETRVPTRLEDRPQVTLRLARLRDGAVVPYADDSDPRRAWSLSEVSVARHRVAACPVPAGLEAAAEAARAQWGRWERESERLLLAVMTAADAVGYSIAAVAESGHEVTVGYDRDRGLRLPLPATAG